MRETWGNWGGNWTLLFERYALLKKHQLCFAFAALRPAVLALHTHTLTQTHMLQLTLVSPHCVWFALVLLLAFVNSIKWLCMSESCEFSDF